MVGRCLVVIGHGLKREHETGDKKKSALHGYSSRNGGLACTAETTAVEKTSGEELDLRPSPPKSRFILK
jgi:hypothetical protein